MSQFIATLENCRFCLMCTHVAPVGYVTKREALTPHGVALTVTSQQRGLIDWNEETAVIAFSEVDGGNSRAHCVNSLPFTKVGDSSILGEPALYFAIRYNTVPQDPTQWLLQQSARLAQEP